MNKLGLTFAVIACCSIQWVGCARRDSARLATRADSAYAAGDRATALRCYEQCLALDPANREALTRTAGIYEEQGEFGTAIQRWYAIGDRGYQPETTASRMARGLADKKIRVDYYLTMAANLQQSRLYGQALCYCDSVLSLASQQPQAQQLKSVALDNIGQQAAALAEAFKKSLAASRVAAASQPGATSASSAPTSVPSMNAKVMMAASHSSDIYEFRENLLNDPSTTDYQRQRIKEIFERNGVGDEPGNGGGDDESKVSQIMWQVSNMYGH